jgi:hypothetical protein
MIEIRMLEGIPNGNMPSHQKQLQYRETSEMFGNFGPPAWKNVPTVDWWDITKKERIDYNPDWVGE